MDASILAQLDGDLVDWRYKSFPPTDPPIPVREVSDQGWNVLRGDFFLPAMVLKESALSHNVELLSRWCHQHGVFLAPHGKTTMSPQVLRLQLEAGAWGVTAATMSQVRVFRNFGIKRILLANELVDASAIAWITRQIEHSEDFDFLCLVDSVEGVTLMSSALQGMNAKSKLQVLVEVGVPRGRSGSRTLHDVIATATAVQQSPVMELAGVEAYEGLIRGETIGAAVDAVDRFLDGVANITLALARAGAFDGVKEIIVTAGGSAFVDRVVDCFRNLSGMGMPVRTIVRSGCYVTHDSSFYDRLSPFGARGIESVRLRPALEIWGTVLSQPEPNRAIIGFGKRDVPYDIELPRPLLTKRASGPERADQGLTVIALDDQHAYVEVDHGCQLNVGEMLGCGISHPCTAFDKWRLLPLVNDNYDVTGAVHTFF